MKCDDMGKFGCFEAVKGLLPADLCPPPEGFGKNRNFIKILRISFLHIAIGYCIMKIKKTRKL